MRKEMSKNELVVDFKVPSCLTVPFLTGFWPCFFIKH